MTVEKPVDCPYYLISRATLAVTAALKKGFAEAGIPQVKPAYLGVLMSLWQADGLKVNELGRYAGLEPSTMTGLLDRMEKDNLVNRWDDPRDRRAHRIRLTPMGQDVRKPVLKIVEHILSGLFGGVSTAELDTAKKLLQQVIANAHERMK
jgi:DNA-binding MarR family transcriptional regulator